MKYWDDMQDKYGFHEGSVIPSDAYEMRIIYITVMNKLLEKLHSTVRVVAWNRPGMHNYLMISLIPMGEYILLGPQEQKGLVSVSTASSPVSPDAKFNRALYTAKNLGLDKFCRVTARIATAEFRKFLRDVDSKGFEELEVPNGGV